MDNETSHLRRLDFRTGIILALLAVGLIWEATSYPMSDSYSGVQNVWYVSPALFPLLVGGLLLLLSLMLVVNAIACHGWPGVLWEQKKTASWFDERNQRFWAIVVLIATYVYAFIPTVDFYIGTAFFLFAFITAFYLERHEMLIISTLFFLVVGVAIGIPGIRLADGTEISPHLRVRDTFKLVSGVRPIKAYPNAPRRLLDERAKDIDIVVLRESTEGLFYTHGRGEIIDDQEARETLRITHPVCEELFDYAFKLARQRKERGGLGRVTCVDKANVFRAFAFFRKIFDERAKLNPDIEVGYNYVDAQALDLIRRPWDFDVLVMENMFGDIISDLGGGLVGGMGMAPCGEIGQHHAMFQPAHGSAPDIMGQDKANPSAMFLSAAMMLDWLGGRHGVSALQEAALLLNAAVQEGFESGVLRPMEFGGDQSMSGYTRALLDILNCGNSS